MRFLRFFVFLLTFLQACYAFALPSLNNNMVAYINRISSKDEKNLSKITRYLVKPYGSDYEKAMAIAYYLASRIAYDDYLYQTNHSLSLKTRSKNAKAILKSKAGLGADFTSLFVSMCQKAGVKAYVQYGFVLPEGERLQPHNRREKKHVWSYFFYEGRKVYVDSAFMSGGRTSFPTFMKEEEKNRSRSKTDKMFAKKIYPINGFYFDFDYASEKQLYHLQRIEQN